MTREQLDAPEVRSGLQGLTVLKTTQSGFENYLQDEYTLLAETTERCMATQMKVEWTYAPKAKSVDYATVRATLRSELMRGFFGPRDVSDAAWSRAEADYPANARGG